MTNYSTMTQIAMKHLLPQQAAHWLQEHPETLFVDCRTDTEFLFVGHPVGAVNIPWHQPPDWEINPAFIAEVSSLAEHNQDRPVMLICRSGTRSVEAAAALEQAGFQQVINVVHGFEGERDEHEHRSQLNGWRYDGLAWEQT
jgi:rhodanese-related sulfurtransferase